MTPERAELIREHWSRCRDFAVSYLRRGVPFSVPVTMAQTVFTMPDTIETLTFTLERETFSSIRYACVMCEGIEVERQYAKN